MTTTVHRHPKFDEMKLHSAVLRESLLFCGNY